LWFFVIIGYQLTLVKGKIVRETPITKKPPWQAGKRWERRPSRTESI